MIELLSDPQVWAAFFALSAMEIVLGIDNVVFISIMVSRLPEAMRKRATQIGLGLALVMRIALLLTIAWIIGLTAPVFSAFGMDFSWRDLILIAGGLFLLWKATHEIHKGIEGEEEGTGPVVADSFTWVILQIAIIDLVFSIDSIITAVGMADHIEVMVAAIVVAIAVMYFAAGAVSAFIEKHPTTKMLALAFLMLIGVALIADGFEFHIPRGYIYASMAFAALVEVINVFAQRSRAKKRASVRR